MKELKLKYNKLVARIHKAEGFFKKCKPEDVDKHLPLLETLLKQSNAILVELKRLGYKATSEEILGGFDENKL